MHITKHSFINFCSQAIVFVFSLLTSIIIARTFGPQGKGIYFLVFMIAATAFSLVQSSLTISGVYYIGVKKYSVPEMTINFIFLAIFLGIIGMAIVFVFIKPITRVFLEGVDPVYLKTALLFIPLNCLTFFLSWICLGLNQIEKYNLINIIRVITTTLFIGIVCLFWRNLLFCIIANLAANLVAFCFALKFLSPYLKIRWRPNLALIKDVISYGWKGHLGEFLHVVNTRLDSYAVKFFQGQRFLGYYSVSLIGEYIWEIPAAIGTSLFPKVSSSLLADREKETAAVCRNAVFLTAVASSILFILAKPAISFLYGKEFLESVKPLWILLPGITSLSITKTLKYYLSGTGRPQIATYSSIAALISSAILNLKLTPIYGIKGAAFSTTCSYLIYSAIILMAFLRISGNKLIDTVFIKKRDFAVYRDFLGRLFRGVKNSGSQS